MGRHERRLRARPGGSRGSRAMRAIQWPPGRIRCVRLHGQGVESRQGRVPAYAAGPHKQGVLSTGECRDFEFRKHFKELSLRFQIAGHHYLFFLFIIYLPFFYNTILFFIYLFVYFFL